MRIVIMDVKSLDNIDNMKKRFRTMTISHQTKKRLSLLRSSWKMVVID
jgi:hypothetical protein